ncbi:MAG: bifunctional [glutamate--ammonia ligase]-adenylyl-L-tyrosine phosphorylase/[glutamate--ammonia-ligase] adenylyltransferase [Wenzhouxiangellaceae bacterium]
MQHFQQFCELSGFAQRCRTRWPELFERCVPYFEQPQQSAESLRQTIRQHSFTSPSERLRCWRQLNCLRIAWGDLSGHADYTSTVADLSALADDCQQQALELAREQLRDRFGELRDDNGEPLPFCVIALGKLGGNELNFSSDIDVLFTYSGDGVSDGRRPLRAQEYFNKLIREWITLLDRVTEHGHVYRVDTRLRPYGNVGALAWNLAALEDYYQREGRDWERFALLKARPCAGDLALGQRLIKQLRPFVFRRYLDYGLFEGVRTIRSEIERESQRRGRQNHIKLGPGGIREVEFLVQSHQILRGGQEAMLRCANTLEALEACARLDLMPAAEARKLEEAYRYLRTLENRLQMIEDQQTHTLPVNHDDQSRLATFMGLDWPQLLDQLQPHLATVKNAFRSQFQDPASAPARWSSLSNDDIADEEAVALLSEAGFDGEHAWRLLSTHRRQIESMTLSAEARNRVATFRPLLLATIAENKPDVYLLGHCLDLLQAVVRRSAYLSLLIENPQALERMVKLFARSPTVVEWVTAQPWLLDDLIDPVVAQSLPSIDSIKRQLSRRLQYLDDDERRHEALTRTQQSIRLQLAIAELTGQIGARQAQFGLSQLAQALLQTILTLISGDEDTAECGFTVIGYGTLGATEMRYGSDLDLVFLYQPERADEPRATRMARRIIHWLTTLGTAGKLYPIDTRLRPNGRSGLLVSSLNAFTSYQRDQAWTWEIQALARARPVAGDQALGADFIQLRQEILCRQREAAQLATEIHEMREKMRRNINSNDTMKHGRGGLVDIQFISQYWQLLLAHRHPQLADCVSTHRLLAALAAIEGPHQQDCGQLEKHWQALARARHGWELTGDFPATDLAADFTGVQQIYRQLFENAADQETSPDVT